MPPFMSSVPCALSQCQMRPPQDQAPSQMWTVSGLMPFSSAASATMVLKVEPGG